uniref:Uncharacterized protein n=1 Tax=Strigamia maritima TaxID=126957 RepID=T1IW21_STRMM
MMASTLWTWCGDPNGYLGHFPDLGNILSLELFIPARCQNSEGYLLCVIRRFLRVISRTCCCKCDCLSGTSRLIKFIGRFTWTASFLNKVKSERDNILAVFPDQL